MGKKQAAGPVKKDKLTPAEKKKIKQVRAHTYHLRHHIPPRHKSNAPSPSRFHTEFITHSPFPRALSFSFSQANKAKSDPKKAAKKLEKNDRCRATRAATGSSKKLG
jgi:hypothetical protein